MTHELHKVLARSSVQLHRYADILERILQTRGDDGSSIGKEIRDAREMAEAAKSLAVVHKPDPRLIRWSRGTRTAAKNYRPAPPGRPS